MPPSLYRAGDGNKWFEVSTAPDESEENSHVEILTNHPVKLHVGAEALFNFPAGGTSDAKGKQASG